MAGQYYDPSLLEALLANMPEVRRRERRSKKLRKSQDRLNQMAERELKGGVTRGSSGPLGDIAGTYIPDYAGMGEKLVGGLGSLLGESGAEQAESEYDQILGQEVIGKADTLGRRAEARRNPVAASMSDTLAVPGSTPLEEPPLQMPQVNVEDMFRGNLGIDPTAPAPAEGGQAPASEVPPEILAEDQARKAAAGGGQDDPMAGPTDEAIKAYLALIGAPKMDDILGEGAGENFNISTRVDRDGNIWQFQKYGAPVMTGIKSERKDKVLRAGDGRVYRIVTTGEGTGLATEVVPPGLAPLPPGQSYEEDTTGAVPDSEAPQTSGKDPNRKAPPGYMLNAGGVAIDAAGVSAAKVREYKNLLDGLQKRGLTRDQIEPIAASIMKEIDLSRNVQPGAVGTLNVEGQPNGVSAVTPSPVQVAPGGVPPATHPFTTDAPAQTRPLTPSDADVAGAVKGAQIDAETDRGQAIADLEGRKAAAKAEAEGDVGLRQAAIADLPNMILTQDRLKQDIPGLINHPGLGKIMGQKVWGRIGNGLPLEPIIRALGIAPGSPEADVVARLDQMKGQVFLPAFQFLRGGGQVTDTEGSKATNAMARMNWAQSVPEFQAAMREFYEAYSAGVAKRQEVAEGKYDMRNYNPGGSMNRSTPKRTKASPEEEARRAAIRAKY